jgi:hypothetical protein
MAEEDNGFEARITHLLAAIKFTQEVREKIREQLTDIRSEYDPQLRRRLEDQLAAFLVEVTNMAYRDLGLTEYQHWLGLPANDPMVQPLPQEIHLSKLPVLLAGLVIGASLVAALLLTIATGKGSGSNVTILSTATSPSPVVIVRAENNPPTAVPVVAIPTVKPPTEVLPASTPLPPVPTPVPPTAKPTKTAIPPTSTITPYPDTPEDTVLGLGEGWTYDEVTLTLLDGPEWSYGSGNVGCSADRVTLRLKFNVSNHSSEPLVFRFDQSNFNITLSNGEQMKWVSGGKMIQLEPGKSTTWHDVYNPERLDPKISLCGDYLEAGVTYIQVEAINFSRIPHAVWRILVNN